MKRSIVIISILLILTSWIGNLVFYDQHHLDEPLFMKHYYEYYGRGNYNIELHYLVNKGEAIHVAYAEFPELEGVRLRVLRAQRDRDYNSHTLKSLFLVFQREDFEKLDSSKAYTIDTINVQFSNGTKKEVNIGKIVIHPTVHHHSEDNPLDMRSSSSSTDHTGYQSYYTQEPLKLTSLSLGLDEEVKDFLHMTVDTKKNELSNWELETELERGEVREKNKSKGVDIKRIDFPMALEKGTSLYIRHAFKAKEKDERDLNYYFIEGRITVEDALGERHFSTYYVDYRPYYTNKSIRQIIRERGDL